MLVAEKLFYLRIYATCRSKTQHAVTEVYQKIHSFAQINTLVPNVVCSSSIFTAKIFTYVYMNLSILSAYPEPRATCVCVCVCSVWQPGMGCRLSGDCHSISLTYTPKVGQLSTRNINSIDERSEGRASSTIRLRQWLYGGAHCTVLSLHRQKHRINKRFLVMQFS